MIPASPTSELVSWTMPFVSISESLASVSTEYVIELVALTDRVCVPDVPPSVSDPTSSPWDVTV